MPDQVTPTKQSPHADIQKQMAEDRIPTLPTCRELRIMGGELVEAPSDRELRRAGIFATSALYLELEAQLECLRT